MKRRVVTKKKRVQFTCLVDAELLERANALRTETWPEVIEKTLNGIVQWSKIPKKKKETTK